MLKELNSSQKEIVNYYFANGMQKTMDVFV